MFDLESYVLNAIWCKIDDGESFTAHDITRAIRDLVGRSEHVDHRDVRSIVHRVMHTYSDLSLKAYTRDVDHALPGLPWRYSPPVVDLTVTNVPARSLTRDQALALGRPLGGKAVITKQPPDTCSKCGESLSNKSWHQYLAHLSIHAREVKKHA